LGGSDGTSTEIRNGQRVLTDDFGRSTRTSVGAPIQSLASYSLYNTAATAGQWTTRLNGLPQYQASANTFKSGGNGFLGRATSKYLSGDIAEVIAYSHVLTGAERSAVQRYLFYKYAVGIYPYALAVSDPTGDADGDGLTNVQEVTVYRTDPTNADSDGDVQSDGYEIANGLNPNLNDTAADLDSDGVPNKEDARPNNSAIGRLTITIIAPLNGVTVP